MSELKEIGAVTAYGLALEQGFVGTLQEWLDSLHARIGENGNWYVGQTDTGVSATGPSLAVTNTAAVGQTVRITEVDENGQPAAWEAVEFPSGDCVVLESPINADDAVWDDYKNFMGFNPETIPVPQEVNGELRAGMVTATGKGRWSSANGQAKPANGGALSDSTFVDGGHVFEGWDASHTYRLTQLIGKWSQGRAHIFSFKPDSSGIETFGIVTVGSDRQYKGMDFAPGYAHMWGAIIAESGFTGANNYGSQKYYGGIAGASKETPDGAYMEVTATQNSTPNQVRFMNAVNGLVVPVLETDPTILSDGMVWFNSTELEFKCVKNGAITPFGSVTAEQVETAVSDYLDTRGIESGATAEQAEQIEQNKKNIETLSYGKVDNSGWTADKYLGTDESGNVVEKDAPSGGNSWVQIAQVTTTEDATELFYNGFEAYNDVCVTVRFPSAPGGNIRIAASADDAFTFSNKYTHRYALETNVVNNSVHFVNHGFWDIEAVVSSGSNYCANQIKYIDPTAGVYWVENGESLKCVAIKSFTDDVVIPSGTKIEIWAR